mmetsp:Transcript_42185/g.90623  ORF Transcript_42185/g.90623 Transcript_42185/m.90623 type:complete len:144 (-) Transcript_42185:15-446(-)
MGKRPQLWRSLRGYQVSKDCLVMWKSCEHSKNSVIAGFRHDCVGSCREVEEPIPSTRTTGSSIKKRFMWLRCHLDQHSRSHNSVMGSQQVSSQQTDTHGGLEVFFCTIEVRCEINERPTAKREAPQSSAFQVNFDEYRQAARR